MKSSICFLRVDAIDHIPFKTPKITNGGKRREDMAVKTSASTAERKPETIAKGIDQLIRLNSLLPIKEIVCLWSLDLLQLENSLFPKKRDKTKDKE